MVIGMRCVVGVDRSGFERDEPVAEIPREPQMFLEEGQQGSARRRIGMDRIDITSEHCDLHSVPAERLADVERKPGVQESGLERDTGDRLANRELGTG